MKKLLYLRFTKFISYFICTFMDWPTYVVELNIENFAKDLLILIVCLHISYWTYILLYLNVIIILLSLASVMQLLPLLLLSRISFLDLMIFELLELNYGFKHVNGRAEVWCLYHYIHLFFLSGYFMVFLWEIMPNKEPFDSLCE